MQVPAPQFDPLTDDELKKQSPYFAVKGTPPADQGASAAPMAKKGAYIGSRSHAGKTVGVALMAIGGLLGLVGAFLPWGVISVTSVAVPAKLAGFTASPTDGLAQTFSATGQWQGWLVVLNGGLLALAALTYLLTGARSKADTSSIRRGFVPALLMSLVTAWLYFGFSADMDQARSALSDISSQLPERLADQPAAASYLQELANSITVGWGMGFMLTVVGCLAAVSGGVTVLLLSGPQVTAIAPGGTKWGNR